MLRSCSCSVSPRICFRAECILVSGSSCLSFFVFVASVRANFRIASASKKESSVCVLHSVKSSCFGPRNSGALSLLRYSRRPGINSYTCNSAYFLRRPSYRMTEWVSFQCWCQTLLRSVTTRDSLLFFQRSLRGLPVQISWPFSQNDFLFLPLDVKDRRFLLAFRVRVAGCFLRTFGMFQNQNWFWCNVWILCDSCSLTQVGSWCKNIRRFLF